MVLQGGLIVENVIILWKGFYYATIHSTVELFSWRCFRPSTWESRLFLLPFGRNAFEATVSEQWIRLQLYFNFKLLLLSHLFAWISFIWRFFSVFSDFQPSTLHHFLDCDFFSPSHSFLIPTIAVGRILFGCIICCRSFTRYFAFIFVIAYITRFIIVEY